MSKSWHVCKRWTRLRLQCPYAGLEGHEEIEADLEEEQGPRPQVRTQEAISQYGLRVAQEGMMARALQARFRIPVTDVGGGKGRIPYRIPTPSPSGGGGYTFEPTGGGPPIQIRLPNPRPVPEPSRIPTRAPSRVPSRVTQPSSEESRSKDWIRESLLEPQRGWWSGEVPLPTTPPFLPPLPGRAEPQERPTGQPMPVPAGLASMSEMQASRALERELAYQKQSYQHSGNKPVSNRGRFGVREGAGLAGLIATGIIAGTQIRRGGSSGRGGFHSPALTGPGGLEFAP